MTEQHVPLYTSDTSPYYKKWSLRLQRTKVETYYMYSTYYRTVVTD